MKRLIILSIIFTFYVPPNTFAQNAGIQIYRDMINQNDANRQARLAREASAAEAQRARNFESQQAAERIRQQSIRNSRLPISDRCLQGSWLTKSAEQSQVSLNIDITENGLVYMDGNLLSHTQGVTVLLANNALDVNAVINDGSSFRQRLTLNQDKLVGSMTAVTVKKGFWKDKIQPAITRQLVGTRLSPAPYGCNNQSNASIDKANTPRNKVETGRIDTIFFFLDYYYCAIFEPECLASDEEFAAAKSRFFKE